MKIKKTIKQKTKSKAPAKKALLKTKIKTKKPALQLKTNTKASVKTKQMLTKTAQKTKTKDKNIANKKQSVKSTAANKLAEQPISKHPPNDLAVVQLPNLNDEEYMNDKQLAHFLNILLQWKERLIKGAGLTIRNMQNESVNHADVVDRASQEEEFNLQLLARSREHKLLKIIEETIVSITNKNYGYCDECGVEIGIKRLEVYPVAKQCIECKTVLETKEKQIGEDQNTNNLN